MAAKTKVEVIRKFKDKRAKGIERNVGDIIEVSQRRLEEIQKAGEFVRVLESETEAE